MQRIFALDTCPARVIGFISENKQSTGPFCGNPLVLDVVIEDVHYREVARLLEDAVRGQLTVWLHPVDEVQELADGLAVDLAVGGVCNDLGGSVEETQLGIWVWGEAER